MKNTVLKYLVTLSLIFGSSSIYAPAQDKLSFLLSQAHTLQERGDYLFAAKLFKLIQSETNDSTIIAEALYGYVTCGDRAAEIFTAHHYTVERLHELNSDTSWKAQLEPFLQHDITNFATLGIQLVFNTHIDYCFNVDTSTRQLLSKKFSSTQFGELATFELITDEVTSDGYSAINDPHEVINRATAFLARYPNSTYKHDAFHILGRAFQDLWEFSRGSYANMLTDKERANSDKLRQEAINYLKLAKAHRKKLLKLEWDVTSEDVLNKLKK